MKKLILLLMILGTGDAGAQNNPIFYGGTGDGWARESYLPDAPMIYSGGQGDGWGSTAYLPSSTSAFTGGRGDGWGMAAYAPDIPLLWRGGDGDGWVGAGALQRGNNVYVGGNGDGWAGAYTPAMPLPVSILSFHAVKVSSRVELDWHTTQETNVVRYLVERSADAVSFHQIGSVGATGIAQADYTFTDYQPAPGYNYYRLKQMNNNGSSTYTPTRVVLFDGQQSTDIMVFPNPATVLLYIRLNTTGSDEPVAVNISSSAGVTVYHRRATSKELQKALEIPVGTWARGLYFVQIKGAGVDQSARLVLE